jgi:molybdopterin synthase catalytic subunit
MSVPSTEQTGIMSVTLQSAPFDPGAELNNFIEKRNDSGAVVSFLGTVRSTKSNPVDTLTLEHYAPLAQKQIEGFAHQAMQKFDLLEIRVIHRFGTLARGEPIVLVLAASEHRQAAFDGANFVMDWLKTDAPFWKREHGPKGALWVSAKSKDDDAKEKWGEP